MSKRKFESEDEQGSKKKLKREMRRVGLLGATGMVGQRFVQLLANHPNFVVTTVGASSRSIGKSYSEAVNWKLSTEIPEKIKNLMVVACTVSEFKEKCDLVFSGLDADVASDIELEFARSGIAVFSNAKSHRMDPDVPILIPAVNPEHLDVIPIQRKRRQFPGLGCIVTNSNCSTTGLVTALKPISNAFGISECLVFTMQAVSGAGYPGVSSLDIYDNVVPFISGEEEKMQNETRKILGTLTDSQDQLFTDYPIAVSAHCNRVPVIDGHTECVSLKLKKPADPEQIEKILADFHPTFFDKLSSAPRRPIEVMSQIDRPQPRLDREIGQGFTVSVGRVRKCRVLDVKFVLLSHNTVIGAAGGSILNAELALAKGYI